MKKALILQHMDHDHPGRFLDFFAEDGIVPVPVRLFAGEDIPRLDGFDLMFVLGGAQDTWEDDKYPWLKAEKAAIHEWVAKRAKPYFGVCLGHQLLAVALGGHVARADASEVGVFDVKVSEAGRDHRFLGGVPAATRVMQWHHAEIKTVPDGGVVLAHSPRAAVQAQAIGHHAMSTQFHCEFSPQTVAGWRSMPEYVAMLEKLLGPGAYDRLLAECFPEMPAMRRFTHQIWDNFKRASGLIS